ncbi:lysine--tRNA ligase [Candidatus Tokpelaia sp.]|uniref:lysine--tRNA ligase n=1 Tax=Candidatus Tokpelaia sp. TaxID=2233777 RepID=UPI001239414B|nr:lysine--tRNA ligase [Candidatus Tokpelaia sp.]KAA6406233.1 lysine--tRNA ligase [Candidatus Tokpelaia sp.]
MPHSSSAAAGQNFVSRATADSSRAWPFEEARKLIRRYEKTGYPAFVLFETGYGPSGLPHIGTFGEVARTAMVRHAFHILTENKVKTRLLCFSDDMDGLRKVPDNVPNRDAMAACIGLPLSRIPDPFGAKAADGSVLSFGAANNNRLCAFLDKFGFDYEFAGASDYYQSGRFDAVLRQMLAAYDEIMAIILPTLGEERRASYAPFLPISPVSGKVLQVPLTGRNVKAGTISYIEPDTGEEITTEVTGGKVKCQWKADWAMRWVALKVDYEMAGKDLIDSVTLSSKICRALGSRPPEGFNYELFLDNKGQKISKSRGNGLTIEEWLTYAPELSLALYMYQKPKTAKKLYFDVIPKAVDEYYSHLAAYPRQDWPEKLNNPVWHIHNGRPPQIDLPVSFALLLNLVSASNAENETVLWGFIERYAPHIGTAERAALAGLVAYALRYFNDFVKPHKKFRAPDAVERAVLADIKARLQALTQREVKNSAVDGNQIQNALLDIARAVPRYQDLHKMQPDGRPGVAKAFFQMLYEVLIGQEKGPRFGSFIALYGVKETEKLIDDALAGKLINVTEKLR